MPLNFRKLLEGLRIVPKASSTSDSAGDLEVLAADGRLRAHDGSTNSRIVTETQSSTGANRLQNKELSDDNVLFVDQADTTKKVRFEVSGVTTGNTRVITVPDADITLASTSSSQLLQNKQLEDSTVSFVDNGDNSKQLKFEVSGITTATTRTLTVPDASTTIVGTETTQTLTNKSIDADANTITNIENADIKAGAAIDASKIADGSVSNAEFQFINSLTSNVQTQINNHVGASTGVHGVTGAVVGTTDTQTLSGKSIDADANTITNIENADIKAGAAIDAAKIADGSVSNTEFQRLDGILSSAVGISDSQVLTNKDIDGGTASNTSRITVPKASKATLDALTRKEATIAFASDEDRLYFDDGTTLRPVGSGSGGLVNLINLNSAWQPLDTDSVDAETSVGNWVAYADSASTAPTDGTGGSPNSTITRTTTGGEVLNGAASFKLTVNSGATRQGEGVSKLCYIPEGYRGKTLDFEFPFLATGTITEDDFRLYAYDVTNSILITPYTYGKLLGGRGRAGCTLNVPSNCAQMRVILHIARAVNTGAVAIEFDDVFLGIQPVPIGLAGSNTLDTTSTLTISQLGTLTDYSSKLTRLGDRAFIELRGQTGTPGGSTVEITLPAGIRVDTTKISTDADGTMVGNIWRGPASSWAATSTGPYPVFFDGSTTDKLYFATTQSSSGQTLTKATGGAFGSNNGFWAKFDIPITGWDANITMAESSTVSISGILANGSRVTGAAPTLLGQYRSYLRNSSATTYTETNGSPGTAPSSANGILIYGGNAFGTADSNNEPSKYEIFVGKNKNVFWQFYTTTGRTSAADAQLYDALGTAPQGCYNGYDPSTGIAYITVGVSSSQTGSNAGTNAGTIAAVKDMYFDIIVSESALAVGTQNQVSEVWVKGGNGAGSTNTSVRRFSTTVTNNGSAITYTDSASLGATFTINENGLYTISKNWRLNSAQDTAISLNQTTDLNVAVGSVSNQNVFIAYGTQAGDQSASISATVRLVAGDIVRSFHPGTESGSLTNANSLRITKVGN